MPPRRPLQLFTLPASQCRPRKQDSGRDGAVPHDSVSGWSRARAESHRQVFDAVGGTTGRNSHNTRTDPTTFRPRQTPHHRHKHKRSHYLCHGIFLQRRANCEESCRLARKGDKVQWDLMRTTWRSHAGTYVHAMCMRRRSHRDKRVLVPCVLSWDLL